MFFTGREKIKKNIELKTLISQSNLKILSSPNIPIFREEKDSPIKKGVTGSADVLVFGDTALRGAYIWGYPLKRKSTLLVIYLI